MIHGAILILCIAVSSRTVIVPQKTVTVVLDSEIAVGGGDDESRQITRGSVIESKRVKNAEAGENPAVIPTRTENALRDVNADRLIDNPGPLSNSFSDVVSGDMQTGHGIAGEGRGTADVSLSGTEGTGRGGEGAGRGGKDFVKAAGALGESGKTAYLKKHFSFIRDMIFKNLDYPAFARKMGWSGDCTVSFVICESGGVENIRIVKSSGYKILDENTVTTIKEIQPFPKPPVKAEIVIPIEYRLERQPLGTRG